MKPLDTTTPTENILTADHLVISSDNEMGEAILNGTGTLVRIPEIEQMVWEIPLDLITPNPDQPRDYFDPVEMETLKVTISDQGQQEEIKVVPYVTEEGDVKFFIIDGERRYRTVKELEHSTVKAIVRWAESKRRIFEQSLIFNLARANHNPMEEARAYSQLIEYEMESMGITQGEAINIVADRIGKSRRRVRNFLRLLKISPEIQQKIMEGLPPEAALRLSSAKRKFGDQLNEVRAAAMIIKNPEQVLPVASRGVTKGQVTHAGIRQAIRESLLVGSMTQEEKDILSIRSAVMAFVSVIGRATKEAKRLSMYDIDLVIETLRSRGQGQPPDVVYENMGTLLQELKSVFTDIVKPAMLPPPLEIPEGAPTFRAGTVQYRRRCTDVRKKLIAQILADASDNEGEILSAVVIAKKMNEMEGCERRYTTAGATTLILRMMERGDLEDFGLRIDTHTQRYRDKRGSLAKRTGYRLAWVTQ